MLAHKLLSNLLLWEEAYHCFQALFGVDYGHHLCWNLHFFGNLNDWALYNLKNLCSCLILPQFRWERLDCSISWGLFLQVFFLVFISYFLFRGKFLLDIHLMEKKLRNTFGYLHEMSIMWTGGNALYDARKAS